MLADARPYDQAAVEKYLADDLKGARCFLPDGVLMHALQGPPQQLYDSATGRVDTWADSKGRATISVRSFKDFVRGDLARTSYNLLLKNCEVFATICRCMRCALPPVDCHSALSRQLECLALPPPPPPPPPWLQVS